MIRKTVLALYYQHGLISFLLFFIPFIPGVVENHTRTYLSLLKRLNHDLKDAEEGIGIVFGQRGLAAYHEYKEAHPEHIRPGEILRLLYQKTDVDLALAKIATLFTNRHQRQHLLSDIYRSTIYTEIPHILRAFSGHSHLSFRTNLVHLFSQALINETSPHALKIGLKTALILFQKDQQHHHSCLQKQQNNQYFSNYLALSSSLVKPSSIYSAPLRLSSSEKPVSPPFSTHALDTLRHNLSRLNPRITPETQLLFKQINHLSGQFTAE